VSRGKAISIAVAVAVVLAVTMVATPAQAQQAAKKPNILIIWGDDIGGSTSAPTTRA